MDERNLKPLTMWQMGFCSPPRSVRKDYSQSIRSRSRLSICRNDTAATDESFLGNSVPMPKTMVELFGKPQSSKKILSRPSIFREQIGAQELDFIKPKTMAQLFGSKPNGLLKQKELVHSVKKQLPFQNNSESIQSARKRGSPRNQRKSITLSSITKNRPFYCGKGMNGDVRNSSNKKSLLDKYSDSKRSAIKSMTAEEVTSTSIPRLTKLRQGTGNPSVKKTLSFPTAPNTGKRKESIDIIHESSLEEMSGIIRLRKSIVERQNNENTQKDYTKNKRKITESSIRPIKIDKMKDKAMKPLIRSSIKKKDNMTKSLSSHNIKNPKRLRFDKSPQQENNKLLDSLMPDVTVTDDSFTTNERACSENTVTKFTCPIGISTPFRQYRTADNSFDQSANSNCSVNVVSPMLPTTDKTDTITEKDENESTFNTLCEMMEGTKLQALHPKCLSDLYSLQTSISNDITSIESKMKQLTKQLELKQNALEIIKNTIKAISDSFSIAHKPKHKISSQKKAINRINSPRLTFSKEPVQHRMSDVSELPKKTHKMDLRKRVLSNTTASKSDENVSPVMKDQLSRQMYLNLKKDNLFLKTPNGVQKSRVLSEHNETPTTVISSNLQKQLHLLYD